jgi:hypothetical protein
LEEKDEILWNYMPEGRSEEEDQSFEGKKIIFYFLLYKRKIFKLFYV